MQVTQPKEETPEETQSQAFQNVKMLNECFQSHRAREMSQATWPARRRHGVAVNPGRPRGGQEQPARPCPQEQKSLVCAPEALTGSVHGVLVTAGNGHSPRKLIDGHTSMVGQDSCGAKFQQKQFSKVANQVQRRKEKCYFREESHSVNVEEIAVLIEARMSAGGKL